MKDSECKWATLVLQITEAETLIGKKNTKLFPHGNL